MNKYIPKNICPNCKLEIWDYDEDKETTICKAFRNGKTVGCGAKIKKKLHNLIGASIKKNEKGHYILEFQEYNETNIYADWKSLSEKMDELAKNDELTK